MSGVSNVNGTPLENVKDFSQGGGGNGEVKPLTNTEAEALKNMGGTPDPVGDTAPRRTPQAGEQIKIIEKDARGKGGSAHYYVTDERGNKYEVDKKTYNSLKKGKGFVDGGQLKPIAEGAPAPIKKGVSPEKAEKNAAKAEVRATEAEANAAKQAVERAQGEATAAKQKLDQAKTQKAKLHEEYKAAQKEMKEARKALTEAIQKEGGDIKGASSRLKTASSNFKNVSRQYKAQCRQVESIIGRSKTAKGILKQASERQTHAIKKQVEAQENLKAANEKMDAKNRKQVVKTDAELEAKKAAENTPKNPAGVERQANGGSKAPTAAEAEVNNAARAAEEAAAGKGAAKSGEAASKVVAKTENTASKVVADTKKAASKVKGGGKFKWLIAGAALIAGIGAAIYATKSDNKVEETSAEVLTNETPTETTQEEETTVTEETATEGDTTTGTTSEGGTTEGAVANTITDEQLAAEESANKQDLADAEAAEAEFNQPITVKPGDCLWNICKEDLKKQKNSDPTNAEIAEAVGKVMAKNVGSLKYETDGYHVFIYPNDTFDTDGTYHRNR